MISILDRVYLKCDCVDGSIVNGIREQILFSFNLSVPPGYKIIKEPTTVLYKKILKHDWKPSNFFWKTPTTTELISTGRHLHLQFNYQDLILLNELQ